jgi:thiamine-monophosphate kinase
MSNTPLGPGVEFDAIRALLGRWGSRAVEIGDDAAVLSLTRGELLVTSVDASVEGRHFRRGWLTPREIGYRAVTAALSDLAAMAARPTGVLVAIGLSDDYRNELLAIADGIGDGVAAASTVIRGGNISAASELTITTPVLGVSLEPITRARARAGESVYVTGRLGAVGEALGRLVRGDDPGPFRERFAHPSARIHEARWLAARGASACIDISDGLIGDLRHLAAASRVSIAVDAAHIPCVSGVTADDAVSSGEEYELIVTCPEVLDMAAFEARFGIPLTRIGSIGEGSPGMVTVHGARVATAASHDHLSR